MHIDVIDFNQGVTSDGRKFGYLGITDRGGQFFTWGNTLQETIDSIEDDDTDPPADWPERAYQNVRGAIRREWARRISGGEG